MKSIVLATCTAAAMLAGGVTAQDQCQIPQSVLDSIDLSNLSTQCGNIARDPTFETCDSCFAGLLGGLLFPLYPSLGLSYADFPQSPAVLAQQLVSGDVAIGIDPSGNDPCSQKFTDIADASGANLQEYFLGIIGCDTGKGWGPLTLDEIKKVNPDFTAAKK